MAMLTLAVGVQAQPGFALETKALVTKALWHVDQKSGLLMIDSSGTHDGVLTDIGLGAPGFLGTAYWFNGSTSKVVVPDATGLDPEASDFIVTVHVRLRYSPKDDYDVIGKGQLGVQYWKIEIAHNGRALCHFAGSKADVELSRGPALNDRRWHTITCRKEATRILLRVDGTGYWMNTTIGSISNSKPVILGQKVDGTDQYHGRMDEVRVAKG